MTKEHDDFQQRIGSIRKERAESANTTLRDITLSRAERAWSPLFDYLQNLADTHFPADKRLIIKMDVGQDLSLGLTFTVEGNIAQPGDAYYRKNPEQGWCFIQSISFRRSVNQTLNRLMTGRFSLKNLFRNRSGNEHAMYSIGIGEMDPKLRSAVLHPARMEEAREVMTYWLAKQMAFDFDHNRINPVSSLKIHIQKRDLTP